MIDVLGAVGGTAAAAFALSVARTSSASSNLSWLSRPISAESHSDPLVMQIASSNFPPIHVGLGMFAAFYQTMFHRLLSSTFVGQFRSLNNFRTSSTEWMNVSMRSVMLSVGAEMIALEFGEIVGSFETYYFGSSSGR